MSEPALFPMFVKLEGRKCVVIGAGNIAQGKIGSLLDAAATVLVIAPEATETISEWAREGRITYERRRYSTGDLAGALLVIVATGDPVTDAAVYSEAESAGVLCNVVDVPKHCSFYYPSVVRRGQLQIAISTAGQSPALAQRLRSELEEQFGVEYEEWIRELGRERERLFQDQGLDPEARRRRLHEMASPEAFRDFVARRGTSRE